MSTGYSLSFAATDRSGPFDQFDELPPGLTPSLVQAPLCADDVYARQHHRRTSSLHAVEHNPFEASFQPGHQHVHSESRKHPHSPQDMTMPVKRPKPSQLQKMSKGSGSDSGSGSGATNSSSTVPASTATDSNNDESPPATSLAFTTTRKSGNESEASSASMSKSMSFSQMGPTSVPMALGRSLPTTAAHYEQLVRTYAQRSGQPLVLSQPQPMRQFHAAPAVSYAPVIIQQAPFEEHVPPPAIEHLQDLARQERRDECVPREERAGGDREASSPERSDDEAYSRTPKKKASKKATAKRASLTKAADQAVQDGGIMDEDRRAQFLERNRVAACKSRQKKKEWIAGLEQIAQETSRRNTDLQSIISGLRDEVTSLRTALAAQALCSCQQMQAARVQQGVSPTRQPHSCVPSAPTSPTRMFVHHQKRSSEELLVSPSAYLHSLSPVTYLSGDYFAQQRDSGTEAFGTPDLTRQLGL